MIAPGGDLKIYMATRPVDFRRGMDGLAAAVQEILGLDPYSGAAFVFRAKGLTGSRFWSGIALDLCSFTSGSRVRSSSGHRFATG